MNFVAKFKAGQAGMNKGLTTGLPNLDRAINGIQRGHSYGVAAAPKCGKTTFIDYAFILAPYLHMEKIGKLQDIEWDYWSMEIDRVSKEFKFAAFFMYHDFGISEVKYKEKTYPMTLDYLMGRLMYNEDEVVPVSEEHTQMLKQIYVSRIIPLFGEFDEDGNQIQPGKIKFIEQADNPTGIYKYCINKAKSHGEFKWESFVVKDEKGREERRERITGFKDREPHKYRIFLVDHIRKLTRERGYTMKENIDKWLEYTTILRDKCNYIFVNVCHSNRGVSNVQRLQQAGEMIFPTADDVKDTGNLAEDSTILMTLFNAHDEKYNLTRHMGVELADNPNYLSLHITESRNTECPAHIQMNAYRNINYFVPLHSQFQ
jgi:hypothetical protein